MPPLATDAGCLCFSYEMQRQSISQSYDIVGTSCGLDPRGGRHGQTPPFAATPGHPGSLDEHAMIAMPQTGHFLSPGRTSRRPAAAIERERSGNFPADEPPTVIAQFQPLDPGIVNETIPAFFIGRNMEGFWVARDVKGQIGGVFLLETSAVSFAKRNSRPAGCATIFPSERIELDLENNGNPFVAHVAGWMRLATRLRQRMAAFIGKRTASRS
jgi:hypothetical protein